MIRISVFVAPVGTGKARGSVEKEASLRLAPRPGVSAIGQPRSSLHKEAAINGANAREAHKERGAQKLTVVAKIKAKPGMLILLI